MDEFKKRFEAAKSMRQGNVEDECREAYMFCFNGRESEWDNISRPKDEPEEIFTDVVATVAEEFAEELFSTMTPENAPWVEYEAGNQIEAEQQGDAKQALEDFERIISKAIRKSNYYTEGSTAFLDAAVGNVAMWVDRPTLTSPINCRAIPISKLFLRLGPMGIDDRFYRERYYYSDLPQLLPNATFPREIQDKIKNSATGKATVVWGFWLDWSDVENPQWLQQVRVDGKEVGMDETLGPSGSCPLIVGRFRAVPGSPWGRGPARRILKTLRVLDELTRMNLEGMDRQLDPAFVYPHDGVLDLSNGIESGIGYPAAPGTADAITPLGLFGNLDYGFFSEERVYETVKEAFYREVVQRGKTPPSASQYVGEGQKNLRRMARPAAKTWDEFGVGLLKRVEYLERQPGGMLVGTEIPLLDDGTVIARPVSPLEMAQAQEEVMVAHSLMGMANEVLGEQMASLMIDGPSTWTNMKEALKDKLVTVRSEDQMMKILQAMQPQVSDAPQQ